MSRNKDATEKPTAKRLKDARRDGQIARTPELGAWGSVLVASWLIPGVVADLFDSGRRLLRGIEEFVAKPEEEAALGMLGEAFLDGLTAVAPLLAGTVLAVIVSAGLQGGLRPSAKLFIPKFSRLNPAQGIKRMFGPKSWWEGAKTLIKTIVLGTVLYLAVNDLVPLVMGSGALPLASLTGIAESTALPLVRVAAFAGLVMAAADYIVIRRRTAKELLMTKQAVKDEHKNSDGNPELKGAIRSKQLAMSRNRMMSEAGGADVVLTNPTHVAVALRYDPVKGAPRVVAKGAGVVAAKIRELAAEHRVPVVRDVPLARALYKNCELGHEIPAELFGAVAQVLAFLYRLKRRGSAAGTHSLNTAAA